MQLKIIGVDCAGTHGYHEGEPADARARRTGAARGVAVTSIAREVRDSDFGHFDLILAMDRGHLRELRGRCPAPLRGKLRRGAGTFDLATFREAARDPALRD